jgi:hypothetical protein
MDCITIGGGGGGGGGEEGDKTSVVPHEKNNVTVNSEELIGIT